MAPVHDAAAQNDVVQLLSLLDAEPGLANAADGYLGSHCTWRVRRGRWGRCNCWLSGGQASTGKTRGTTRPSLSRVAGRAEVVSFLLTQEPGAAWWSEDLSAGLMKAMWL